MNQIAQPNLQDVVRCAQDAGEVLLSHFYSAFSHQITMKSDQSPVTQADVAANAVINARLTQIDPMIPILSEENNAIDYAVRQTWNRYWLVDPLDGTRGFIRRDASFCVNIALVENHKPILGVIYAPVEKYAVYAAKNQGVFLLHDNEIKPVSGAKFRENSLHILTGKFDKHPQFRERLQTHFNNLSITEMNSALKFAKIAQGLGDLYVRLGPTSEWDTAAGQCIVEEAGGLVVDFEGQPLQYNAKSSLINPSFLAMGDASQCEYYTKIMREMR